MGFVSPLCGMEVISYCPQFHTSSSEFTSTTRISLRMIAQNDRVEGQFPQILVLCLPNHNSITLFELKYFVIVSNCNRNVPGLLESLDIFDLAVDSFLDLL